MTLFEFVLDKIQTAIKPAPPAQAPVDFLTFGRNSMISRQLPGDNGIGAGYIPHPYRTMGLMISPDQNIPHVTPDTQRGLSDIISRVSLHRMTGF
jgi:hypothetical protein